jgi:uncharacterized damage-inducible protein DinB
MKRIIAPACLALVVIACQQAPPPAPPAPPPSKAVTQALKQQFDSVKDYLTRSADQFPEAKYSYQPTKAVRTFGQIIGHVANENWVICAAAGGDKGPGVDVEKTVTKKADLQKALADSFAACDKVFASMDDQQGGLPAEIPEFQFKSTKLGMLAFNTSHDFEHYGNLITYMRLNNMVPPSSQPSK